MPGTPRTGASCSARGRWRASACSRRMAASRRRRFSCVTSSTACAAERAACSQAVAVGIERHRRRRRTRIVSGRACRAGDPARWDDPARPTVPPRGPSSDKPMSDGGAASAASGGAARFERRKKLEEIALRRLGAVFALRLAPHRLRQRRFQGIVHLITPTLSGEPRPMLFLFVVRGRAFPIAGRPKALPQVARPASGASLGENRLAHRLVVKRAARGLAPRAGRPFSAVAAPGRAGAAATAGTRGTALRAAPACRWPQSSSAGTR